MSEPRGPNDAFAASLADELARGGVTHVCIAPGSRSGPLALAFEREPHLQTHVHLDERSAAYFALGIGRATGSPAVIVCTSGTAAANLFPAIVEARHGLVPMIVVTADRPPELRATGANQTVDQIKMFGDAVVWFAEAGVPDEAETSPGYWRALVCRAVAAATSGPGPVHINAALREPLYPDPSSSTYRHPTAGRADGRPWTEVIPAGSHVPARSVDAVARAVRGSERGLVVAGATSGDLAVLLELAKVAGWPVIAEPASNIRVPGTISCYDALLRSDDFVAAHRPEVVLRVGKLALGRPLARLLRGARQVAIGSPGTWWDEHRSIETMVVADPAALSAQVLPVTEHRPETSWMRSWRASDELARRAIDEVLDTTGLPTEPRAARDLAAALPDGANLFAAASMPVRDLDSFMAPRRGITVHANRGANGIDGSISTAFGIAAATRAPTAALIGDLALLHDSTGMLYDARSELDVSLVVINNDGGGIFSFLEQASVPDFERVFGTPHGIDLAAWAKLYAISYTRLASASDLAGWVRAGTGVRMIEVRTDRDENVKVHRGLWDAVQGALASGV